MIYIMIDSVNKFAVFAINVTYSVTLKVNICSVCVPSVATNPVTSLEFNPIHCATTLCHFGRTWDGYVVMHFYLLASIAEGSATSGYVVVPERFNQNEETAGSNKEWAKKKPSLVPKVDIIGSIVLPSM